MLGLYTRNGFILFPNAYTTGKNEAENLAQSLNMSNEDGLLGQHAVYENAWDFGDIATLRPELKRNKVFETFEKTVMFARFLKTATWSCVLSAANRRQTVVCAEEWFPLRLMPKSLLCGRG